MNNKLPAFLKCINFLFIFEWLYFVKILSPVSEVIAFDFVFINIFHVEQLFWCEDFIA